MKTFWWRPSTIFSIAPSVGAGKIWVYFRSHLFSIIANKFYLHLEFLHYITIKWHICWCWGFLSVFSWIWIQITLIRLHHPCYRPWSRITVLCTTASMLKHVETLSIQRDFKGFIAWNRISKGHINLAICLN